MKTRIATINAKYIHTSLAVRWLYVASKDIHDVHFKEYTLKESIESIGDDILESHIDILGLGVYIWNVRQIKMLCAYLKNKKPELIIVLGGPEVSYEAGFFIDTFEIDYVVCGEGEFVFRELLTALKERKEIKSPHIAHTTKRFTLPAVATISELEKLESPYMLSHDASTQKQRVIYFETSRGCPYMCQYCLSSLEKGVRYFSFSYIDRQLEYLFKQDVKIIKFLDRTFNLNQKHTYHVFEKIKTSYNAKTQCQFEIYADLLKPEMLTYLSTFPKEFLRFEIGIQSTYNPTNKAVQRMQNFEKIVTNIQQLQKDDVVDLHLDLIAGLPYEDYDRFRISFNDVFVLQPKELQLGFLKMLRGTALRKQAELYEYLYDLEGPYEIYQNHVLSNEDLQHIKYVEDMLEKYWNSGRFRRTLRHIFNKVYQNQYFEFFHDLGVFYEQEHVPRIGYQPYDLYELLVRFLTQYMKIEGEMKRCLFLDYYSMFRMKPKKVSKTSFDKNLNEEIYSILKIKWDKENLEKLTKAMYRKYFYIECISDHEYLAIYYFEHKFNYLNLIVK